jgi:hypothetical protein
VSGNTPDIATNRQTVLSRKISITPALIVDRREVTVFTAWRKVDLMGLFAQKNRPILAHHSCKQIE